MNIYINYPNSRITIHHDPSCAEIQKHRKSGQRAITVTQENRDSVIQNFRDGKYEFCSQRPRNDLWVHLSLSTPESELEFVRIVHALLGQRYERFNGAQRTVHC